MNDPLGDKEMGLQQLIQNLSKYKYGGTWDATSGLISSFSSDIEVLTKGAVGMSENSSWGTNGWAMDYASASDNF